jgi:hypothetical protein
MLTAELREGFEMQISRFHNGDFVIHGITWLSRSKISAWFNAKGALVDAEYIDATNRSRPVSISSPIRSDLATLGRVLAKRKTH